MPAEISSSLIALAGTVLGGIGLEITRRWLNRARDKDDMQRGLRDEMRTDMIELKKDLSVAQDDIIEWKNKYYELLEKYIKIQNQYEGTLQRLSNVPGVDKPA